MKQGKGKDAKRRKLDGDGGEHTHKGPKKFNKSDDKKQKPDYKSKGGDKKFSGKTNPPADKSTIKKKLKPKKTKGKKNRNRNK